MSSAWEITEDDVSIVLNRHGIKTHVGDTHDLVCEEAGRVEKAALFYDDLIDQVDSALDEIENILIEKGVIVGDKLFSSP